MQKLRPLLLLVPFIIIGIISFKPDSKDIEWHKIGRYYINVPDKLPEFNGLYWANKHGDTLDIQPYMSREYQIEVDIDSSEIWDGDRLVGKIPYDSASKFDLLINKDNE